jgi:hypothetical protein
LKYRVKVKAILVSHLSLFTLPLAYLYQQSRDQTVHKVPLRFQDVAGLRQIELDTCTLLWLVFRLSEVYNLPYDTSVRAPLVRRTLCSLYSSSCRVLRSILACTVMVESVIRLYRSRHPQHTHTGSNSSTIAADSSKGVTNTRCCRYGCMCS